MMGRGSMKFVLLSATAIALIACSGGDRRAAAASVGREAGSFIDNGDFGNSTMNNTLIQSGQRVYTINLGRRFSSGSVAISDFPIQFQCFRRKRPRRSTAAGGLDPSVPRSPVQGLRSHRSGRWHRL